VREPLITPVWSAALMNFGRLIRKSVLATGLAALVTSACDTPPPIYVSPEYNTPELVKLINTKGTHDLQRGESKLTIEVRDLDMDDDIDEVYIVDRSKNVKKSIWDKVFDGVPDLVNIYESNDEGTLVYIEVRAHGKLTHSTRHEYDDLTRTYTDTYKERVNGKIMERVNITIQDKHGNDIKETMHVDGNLSYSKDMQYDAKNNITRSAKNFANKEFIYADNPQGAQLVVETWKYDTEGRVVDSTCTNTYD